MLKDTWVDSDRMREGDILTSLHAAADEEDKELIEAHFLTTISHGDVWTESDIVDDTAMALMRGLNITKEHPLLFQLERKSIIQGETSAPGAEYHRALCCTQLVVPPRDSIRYAPKTHYRIVFKEVCTTIDRIRSLPDVMGVLTETVSGAFQYCTDNL